MLTTLHTNDAIGAVARLLDMGAEPFLVASALTLVVAQRLVRKPCLQCRVPQEPNPRVVEALGLSQRDLANGSIMAGRGCNSCRESGFRGRTGIFEVLPISDGIRQAMTIGGDRVLNEAANATKRITMRQSGINAALKGDTTLEEVLRVTSDGAWSQEERCSGCHREIHEDMTCCPYCGTPTGVLRCASCTRELDPEWSHCPYCKAPNAGHVASGSSASPTA